MYLKIFRKRQKNYR